MEIYSSITVPHMVRFLKEFINNDRIGNIASCHLANSDANGVASPRSIELARYCSIAVDFPKTGCPANIDKNLRPIEFPDFMERNYRESYQSKKALGKLYRVCRDFQEQSRAKSSAYEDIQVDQDFVYPGWEKYQAEAESTLTSYQNCMLHVLGTYGVKHESEALSGAFSAIHSRFKESKDRWETEELVGVYIRALWKKYKDNFWTELGENQNRPDEVTKKVSAYYVVTYRQEKPMVLSLPWIFTRQLAHMKHLKLVESKKSPESFITPPLVKLNTELEKISMHLPGFDNLTVSDCYQAPVFANNNFRTLREANDVVLHWAQNEGLLYRHDVRPPKKGFMDRNSVTRLFLYVARQETRDDGAIPLVVKFLKYCISLRFLSGPQRNKILPFSVPQSGLVSKIAMQTYRNIAVSADLSCLNIIDAPQETEHIEMDTFMIQVRSVGSAENLRRFLVKESGVEYIHIRKEGKWKFAINAVGSASCIRTLESVLRKGDRYLQNALGHVNLHFRGGFRRIADSDLSDLLELLQNPLQFK